MIRCEKCGYYSEDGKRFCTECGAPLPAQSAPRDPWDQQTAAQQAVPPQPYQQPYQQPGTAQPDPNTWMLQSFGTPVRGPRAQSFREFLKLPENKPLKRQVNAAAIICYVCAGVTLALNVIVAGELFSLIDFSVVLGMGLGIHLRQSRVCAIILAAFALLNTILILINSHSFGGWLILLAGIYAVISTFSLQSRWKKYQEESDGAAANYGG